jgi:hypothetical protein
VDRCENGELTAATYRDYHAIRPRAADVLGNDRPVSDLVVSNFDELRRSLAKKQGPNGLEKDNRVARMLFKFGCDAEPLSGTTAMGP